MNEILPKVGDIIVLNSDNLELYVLAVDENEGLWTCVDRIGILQMWNFDENKNSGKISVNVDVCFADKS
jgi:hypothetical protein